MIIEKPYVRRLRDTHISNSWVIEKIILKVRKYFQINSNKMPHIKLLEI